MLFASPLAVLLLGASSEGGSDLFDSSDGSNWSAYGRTYGEQHYSPLKQIDAFNVTKLGLAWFLDLGAGNSATIPLEVDGVVYFASGLSVVHAIDATSGKALWVHDTEVAKVAGQRMRNGWGSRGIAYWKDKVYTGAADGRLIALDSRDGHEVWSQQTLEPGDFRYITGAPRVFDGKIIIGHAGADISAARGYVTTYDAQTGKFLWRFYTVPGNPARGFEDAAQAKAAKTWSGDWWKYGGGGTAWNAITYDAETDTVFIGTGNGAPWNHRVRSQGKGDNLYLCSIVALDAKTGHYKWHYQINPGESWDYVATMDMQLAVLDISGTPRKVLMTAPKNGFFYVIDRTSGKLISAEKIAKVTWATKIDLATGRPVEVPNARYQNGETFTIWPSPLGAHSWMPMAYSPETRLAYIPVNELGANFSDKGVDLAQWHRLPGGAYDMATNYDLNVSDPLQATSSLLAWNPATQKVAWKVPTPRIFNGGVMATAGNLVYQGQNDGTFRAYAADTGKLLWSFQAQAPILAAPITYMAGGRQYVTVLTGMGTSGALLAQYFDKPEDPRSQAKRVLTFAIDGNVPLPPHAAVQAKPIDDPTFKPDQALETRGAEPFARSCASCHGSGAYAGGGAPDLRGSPIPLSADAFASVVRGGALQSMGMPRFEEFDDAKLAALRQYIRAQAELFRHNAGQ